MFILLYFFFYWWFWLIKLISQPTNKLWGKVSKHCSETAMSIVLLLTMHGFGFSDPFKFMRHEGSLPWILLEIVFFTLKRELKGYIILSSWIRKPQYCYYASFPELIYRFNIVLIKIPGRLFYLLRNWF